MELKDINDKIVQCRSCSVREIIPAPRHGAGSTNPDVVVLLDEPDNKALHGGGGLFYGPAQERTMLGKCIEAIFGYQKLSTTNLYITSAAKCPGSGTCGPSMHVVRFCANRFLSEELKALQPKIVIAVGMTSAMIALEHERTPGSHQVVLEGYKLFNRVAVHGKVVFAPYPLEIDQWVKEVSKAIGFAKENIGTQPKDWRW